MQNADPKQVATVLSQYYSTSELQTMSFELGVDYEDIGGQGKSGKARELVTFMNRRGRLGEIVAYVRETRPQVAIAGESTPRTATTEPSQTPAQPTSVTHIHVGGDYFGGGKSGDTFNMSGDFRGANLNVKSTLSGVHQTVGTLPQANKAQKAELQQLIVELDKVLQQVPADKEEEADAVAQFAETLVNTAVSEKPNKMMMQITGEGLKKAAENLVGIVPAVVKIAGAIVTGILGLDK